tara:strand:+ start:438 stop:683 length:246 start_codon:yes stop_codon:yes gene_type:complete
MIFGVSGDILSPGFGGKTALGCEGGEGRAGVGVGCACMVKKVRKQVHTYTTIVNFNLFNITFIYPSLWERCRKQLAKYYLD